MRCRTFAFVLALTAVVSPACSRTAPPVTTEAGGPLAPPTIERAVVPAGPVTSHGGLDTDAARAMRAALVRSVTASGYVRTERVRDAMMRVPRHLFVPGATLEEAYGDSPFPIGSGQTISQPTVVGEMTEALELRGPERVLEIGTGSGYQAAILSLLAEQVYSIELIPELGEPAAKRLGDLGYSNVEVRIGDGYAGWPEKAPFDRIIVTAAAPEVPRALLEQLADGGVLVAPVGEQMSMQWLTRIRKKDGHLTRERLSAVRFVPLVPGR